MHSVHGPPHYKIHVFAQLRPAIGLLMYLYVLKIFSYLTLYSSQIEQDFRIVKNQLYEIRWV